MDRVLLFEMRIGTLLSVSKIFPIQESIVPCTAGTNVVHHTCLYKVHKIHLNTHTVGRAILSVK